MTPNLFTDYPSVPWKQGWLISSGADDTTPFMTGRIAGTVSLPNAEWTLQLFPESDSCFARFFHNGFSLCTHRQAEKERVDLLSTAPGVVTGLLTHLPPPILTAPTGATHKPGVSIVEKDHHTTLLLLNKNRFALVTGKLSSEQALRLAEDALDLKFDEQVQQETDDRQSIMELFSINPRHNPAVALAAESLPRRLRNRTAAIHGVWSVADGFEEETFSLNELYPLVSAWVLIDPSVAMTLVQTTLSLQQGTGGFPAWVNRQGATSTVAPWPLIAQTFELAWEKNGCDPLLLKQTLPILRKYIQWALRRFDPYRDGIPFWQSDQEVFVPNSFERNKATPELTAILLEELDALLRLCAESDHSESAIESLSEQRKQLAESLTSIFWNPQKKAFSNVWKDGHFIDKPSFGSFMPLLWKGLEQPYRTPLLESFEETHGFPGHKPPDTWKKEEIDDTDHLPIIHQFMAFEALRHADKNRALLLLFVRRAREGFAAWFERESIEAARQIQHADSTDTSAYTLGPVTASLILTTQYEFQREAKSNAPIIKQLIKLTHRFRFNKTDLRILIVFSVAAILVHLAYAPDQTKTIKTDIAEAALNYKQGRLQETMDLCRRYPDNALCQFLKANLLMLVEKPEDAEDLYHKALRKNTASPSALIGYALTLQLNGKLDDAIRRYNDFLDLYEDRFSQSDQQNVIDLAYEFLNLAEAGFSKPPKWKRLYTSPLMNDLGL